MSIKNASQPAKPHKGSPILFVLAGLAVLAVLLTVGGFGFAAVQESHDAFCASCHTQPESTFYQRSMAAAPSDMASVHTAKQVNCIDCHSGNGVTGRLGAELLGAWNAAHWYTGTAVQPAKLTMPISDMNCIKCHQNTVAQQRGRQNHFHTFLARWQTVDPNAGGCVSCHGGHTTSGSAATRFMDEVQTQQVCDACHRAIGEGGG